MATEIGLAILAAGLSRRFGTQDKLMAPLDGRPLCDHIAQTASTFDAGMRLAICAPGSPATAVFTARGFQVIENPHPEDGLSSSVKLAVGYAAEAGLSGLVVCLADMPFVPLAHLDGLFGQWLEAGRPHAMASRAAGPGGWVTPPAIFGASTFPDLLATSGNTGARALLVNAETLEIDATALADFDTIDDFRRARG